MKKSAILVAALSVSCAFAAPLYFTFVGPISFVPEDRGGYAAAHNIRVGTTVAYVFVVDTTLEGFTKFQGTKKTTPDINNPGYAADYFFDSLITPSLFSPAVTDSASGSYLGFRTIISGTMVRHSLQLQTTIGNPDKRAQVILSFADTGGVAFLPKVGDKAAGTETYIDSSVASSSATMTMTCTAVSATRPSSLFRPLSSASRSLRAVSRGENVYFLNRNGSGAVVDVRNAAGKSVRSRQASFH